jgi:recombination protein RecA
MPPKGWRKPTTKTEQRKALRTEDAKATEVAASKNGSALDAVAAIINKKFGDATFVKFDDASAYPTVSKVVSTGLPALDAAIGVGGIPVGVLIEIFGAESVGKSSICKWIAGHMQKAGVLVVPLDGEYSADAEFDKKLGLDPAGAGGGQVGTLEEAFEIFHTSATVFKKKKVAGLGILDSLAATPTQDELERGFDEESRVGGRAGFLAKNLKKLVDAMKDSGFGVIIVNQLRDTIGAMPYQKQSHSPGGRALRHWCHLRMEMTHAGAIRQGDTQIGIKVKVKIVKSKIAPPGKSADLEFYFDPPRFVDPSVKPTRQPLRVDK